MQAQIAVFTGRNGRRHHPRQTNATRQPSAVSVAYARMEATLALENIKTLEAAAEARSRNRSWQPGDAGNHYDYAALAAAEAVIARWHRMGYGRRT